MTPTTIILTTSTTTLQVELQYNYNYNYTRQEIDTQKGDEIKRHKEKVTARVRERGRERERDTQSLNLLSTRQWVRSAIHASKQLTSPIVSYLCCAVLLVTSLKIDKMMLMFPLPVFRSQHIKWSAVCGQDSSLTFS